VVQVGLEQDAADPTNPLAKILRITPVIRPEPLEFRQPLDLGAEIPGLAFNASGEFNLTVQPEFRIPLGIKLNFADNTPRLDRVFLFDDEEPDVTVEVTVGLDSPRARASLGFLSVQLEKDTTIPDNEGIVLTTTVTMNLVEPASTPQDGRILLRELVSFTNLPSAAEFGISGELDIAGLKVTPEFAGIDLPGRIDIFTTTDVPAGPVDINTPRGPVAI